MSQCQRCGATNEPTSRFCVACGSPLAAVPAAPAAVPATRSSRPPPMAPPAGPSWGQPAAPPFSQPAAPAFAPPPAVIVPSREPASENMQFAATAAPPTREEFEAQRAAAQAAAAAMRAGSWPPPPPGRPTSQPPPRPSAAPVAGYHGAPATAAMPGVSQDPEQVPEGAPRMLAGFLVSFDTQPLGRFWPIYQGRSRVGRQGSGAEVELELDHPTASSRHAILYASACPGRIKLEDAGSTNGTMLNGSRLAPGARHELRDGDRIRFGLLSTVVKIV